MARLEPVPTRGRIYDCLLCPRLPNTLDGRDHRTRRGKDRRNVLFFNTVASIPSGNIRTVYDTQNNNKMFYISGQRGTYL